MPNVVVLLPDVPCSQKPAWPPGWGNSSAMCVSVCCGRVRLLHLLFYFVGPPVGVNISVGLNEPLLGLSPPLKVASLLVVAPLEVEPPLEVVPLMRSRGLPVVQEWERLGLGC